MNKPHPIMMAFTFLLGLVVFSAGIFLLQIDTSDWIPTEARVIPPRQEVETSGGDESPPSYTVKYEYTVGDTKYTGDYSTSFLPPEIGQAVAVRYDPADPGASTILEENQSRLFDFGCLAVGAYFMGSVIWGLVKARRRGATETL